MTILESTAIARARATKASFPKGTISISQARAMLVAMCESQVGYASGNPNWSMYGKASNWPEDCRDWLGRQVYWCVLGGGSWAPAWAFGRAAALAGFGRQVNSNAYPPVGGTWTVWVLTLARAQGRVKRFEDAQAGDIVLTRWGRTGAEVDHFDIATGPRSGNMVPVIGFNTSSGNASAGAGVFRAWRPSQRVVAIVEPDYPALVSVYNATVAAETIIDFTRVATSLLDLGYTADESGVRAFQSDKDTWGHNLVEDGVPGPATERALGDAVNKIDEVLNILNHHIRGDLSEDDKDALGTGRNLPLREVIVLNGVRINQPAPTPSVDLSPVLSRLEGIRKQLNTVGRVAAEARELARSVPQRVAVARVPFIKGTSLHRLFGDDFRVGALWGYGAASMVDRDTHTEEIVDAIDAVALEGDMHDNEQNDLDMAVDVDNPEEQL